MRNVYGRRIRCQRGAGEIIPFAECSRANIMMPHMLSTAVSGPFVTSESMDVLLESDPSAAFMGYSMPYTKASNVGGAPMFQSVNSVSNLW